MNDSKTGVTETFDPYEYEEIPHNLRIIATLLSGLGWRQAIGHQNNPEAEAIFKLMEMLETEARQVEKFFNEAHAYMQAQRMNDGTK